MCHNFSRHPLPWLKGYAHMNGPFNIRSSSCLLYYPFYLFILVSILTFFFPTYLFFIFTKTIPRADMMQKWGRPGRRTRQEKARFCCEWRISPHLFTWVVEKSPSTAVAEERRKGGGAIVNKLLFQMSALVPIFCFLHSPHVILSPHLPPVLQ